MNNSVVLVILAIETLLVLFLLWQSAYQKAEIDHLREGYQDLQYALAQLTPTSHKEASDLKVSLVEQQKLHERQQLSKSHQPKPASMPVVKLSPKSDVTSNQKAQTNSPVQPPKTTAAASIQKPTSTERAVFTQLMATCENWRRWYQEDHKERSLKHRENACRDAKDYAQKYGLTFTPHTATQ